MARVPPSTDPRPLPGGLLLRSAVPGDLDQIAALLTARGEAADVVDHWLVVEDPDSGWESCAVVVDGDRVVSTATPGRDGVPRRRRDPGRAGRTGGHRRGVRRTRSGPGADGLGARTVGGARSTGRGDDRYSVLLPPVRRRAGGGCWAATGVRPGSPSVAARSSALVAPRRRTRASCSLRWRRPTARRPARFWPTRRRWPAQTGSQSSTGPVPRREQRGRTCWARLRRRRHASTTPDCPTYHACSTICGPALGPAGRLRPRSGRP